MGKKLMTYKTLSIICLSCVPYLFSLQGDFVFDDSEAVVKNKDVFSDSWTDSFLNDFWGTNIKANLSHKSYRPLTTITFRLNYKLSGKKLVAAHFKITNLLCHVICCLLAWQTFYILIKPSKDQKKLDDAYIAALLFSVHPIHVEPVSGIVGRADILAGITFFLAFLAYVKAQTARKYGFIYLVLCVVISGIAMLCKEYGITVLGFCICHEIVTKLKLKRVQQSKNIFPSIAMGSVVRVCIVALSAALLLYGRWAVMGGTTPVFKPMDNPAAFADKFFTRIATYNYLYFINFMSLVWPKWLCYDWSMGCIHLIGSKNILDYRYIFIVLINLYCLLLIRTLIHGKVRRKSKRQLISAVSLLVIPFLPATNILFPVGFVIAERVLYISSAGYCLLVVIGLQKVIRRYNVQLGIFLYGLLILTYALRSWQRSLEWKNEYLLFTSALSVCPLNAKVHYNVAKVADANLYTEWALEEYRIAIRLYPEYYQAMNNLANLLKNQNKFNEAEFYLQNAISLKEDFPAAWMNLGIVLGRTKRYKESHDAYNKALQYRRNYPDCIYNLGNLYLELNETKSAMETWLEAIKLSPKHNLAWTNLLALLDNTGQLQKALEIIPTALNNLPDSPHVNFVVANVYGKLDRYEDAEKHYLLAIKLFDKNVQAIHFANLGVLYHRWEKYSLAQELYQKSLRRDPQYKSASKNLQSLLKRIKNNNNK